MEWVPPALPPLDLGIGRQTVLEEDQQPVPCQNTCKFAQGLVQGLYRAEREGTDDGVDAPVVQGNAFARQRQERDVDGCSASLPVRQASIIQPSVAKETST